MMKNKKIKFIKFHKNFSFLHNQFKSIKDGKLIPYKESGEFFEKNFFRIKVESIFLTELTASYILDPNFWQNNPEFSNLFVQVLNKDITKEINFQPMFKISQQSNNSCEVYENLNLIN